MDIGKWQGVSKYQVNMLRDCQIPWSQTQLVVQTWHKKRFGEDKTELINLINPD